MSEDTSPPGQKRKTSGKNSSDLSSWIIGSLNQLDQRCEQRFNRLDQRLRRLEHLMWIACGSIMAVGVLRNILRLVLSNFDIPITHRP